MTLTLKDLEIARTALFARPAPCCDKPNPYSDLRLHVDEEDDSSGYIVQLGCENCGRVYGFMHPYAWLDILEENDNKVTDILKRGSE